MIDEIEGRALAKYIQYPVLVKVKYTLECGLLEAWYRHPDGSLTIETCR